MNFYLNLVAVLDLNNLIESVSLRYFTEFIFRIYLSEIPVFNNYYLTKINLKIFFD